MKLLQVYYFCLFVYMRSTNNKITRFRGLRCILISFLHIYNRFGFFHDFLHPHNNKKTSNNRQPNFKVKQQFVPHMKQIKNPLSMYFLNRKSFRHHTNI